MNAATCTALTCLLLASPPTFADDPDVAYAVRPIPDEQTTTLDVRMRFRGDADGVTRISLPRCRYGTPRLREFVHSVAAEGAEIAPVADDPAMLDLTHEPGATVTLRYVMAWDPDAHPGVAYRPSTGPTHFHFFGPQWRATFPEREQPLTRSFRFRDVPNGWSAFTNMGVGDETLEFTATEDDFPGFIAGGDYHHASFDSNGTPVHVYVRGRFDDPAALIDGLQDALIAIVDAFGALDLPFYVVSISERDRIRAGTALDNAFVCLTSPTASHEALLRLITHEAFHNWLPGAATIDGRHASGLDEYRLDWFFEGFTEYCARRILLDAGLVDHASFVEWFNEDLEELARNPQQDASLDDVADAIVRRAYTNRHERLSYTRGPLLALCWDAEQRVADRTPVPGVVRAFIDAATHAGGSISESDFFDLLQQHGIDARADYQRCIVEGRPVTLPEDVFGAGVAIVPHGVDRYEPGFDVDASLRQGALVGVDENGPAHAAGAREGMAITRFESERKPGQVARLVLTSGDVLEFLPVETVETVRFVVEN